MVILRSTYMAHNTHLCRFPLPQPHPPCRALPEGTARCHLAGGEAGKVAATEETLSHST